MGRKKTEKNEKINMLLEELEAEYGKDVIYLKLVVEKRDITSLTTKEREILAQKFTELHPEYFEYRALKANTPIKWQSPLCTTIYIKRDLHNIKYKFTESLSQSETAGERIVRLRKERGLTRKQLAMDADINYRTLQTYEAGERDIQNAAAFMVKRIADALNVTMEELLA